MILLAISDVVWQAVIGGFVTITLALVVERSRRATVREAREAAKEVREVKTTLEAATLKTDGKIDATGHKMDDLAVQVQEVHDATNGMKHELVEEVRKASFAQGVKSETDKGGP